MTGTLTGIAGSLIAFLVLVAISAPFDVADDWPLLVVVAGTIFVGSYWSAFHDRTR